MCQGGPPREKTGAEAAMEDSKPATVGTPSDEPAAGGGQHRAVAAGSREQQPAERAQQQAPASSSQQDGSQQVASLLQQQGSKQSAGSGGSGRRARGASSKDDSTVVVAGKEVVGRQVAVWSPRTNDWPKATIAQHNPTTQQHLVRYMERPQGAVKHHEQWVHLARLRFQWLSDPPPAAAANPTYASAPRGEDAVHWRVKVFWPGMAKWYVGKVTSYDPKTRKHSVRYRDGDTQELQLRHEAVQYLDREVPPAPRQRPDEKKANVDKGRGKKKAAGAGGAGGKKGPATNGSSKAVGTKRAREGSAGGEEVSSGAERGGGQRKCKSHKSGSAARAEGRGGTPVAAPPTASPPKDVVAGSHNVSAVMMGDSEEGQVDSQGGMAPSDDLLYSSGMESEEEDLGSEVFISGLEEEEDSDFEVESVRNRRRGGNKAASTGAARSASRRGSGTSRPGSTRRGGSRRRGRDGGGVRRSSGSVPRSSRRDAQRGPAAALRKVVRADEESIRAAGAGVVNARVAVFWHEDERYYKGKLIQFDSYHKRHKIVYDDGEEEWVSLQREAFRWLTPRARSAGCTPAFRHHMQQLGAEECGSGVGMATRRQAQAGSGQPGCGDGAVDGPKGEACVGWQVSLLFDGDGRWHRAEVVGWDARGGRALLLYDDGEDEWVALEREELTWHGQVEGHSGVYPGLPRGDTPAGPVAVGWRVGVYWPADQAFYSGEIVGYDTASGRHEVAYDDGEEGPLQLGVDKIKWILAPGAAVDRERLEEGGCGGVRGRRRGGDDSDPDYEAFEYRPRAAPGRRPFQRTLSDGLSPAPTPLAGGPGLHPWDVAAGAEASLAENNGAQLQRFLSLPQLRPSAAGSEPNAPHLGQPVVVRQMSRVAGLGCLGGGEAGGPVALPQPITVRIYMSSSASSTGSAASADTQMAAALAAPLPHGRARLEARVRALGAMSQRVAKAQQTIVKGVPTPLPSRMQVEEAARQACGVATGGGLTSPTAAGRLLGSSHTSGLHRLARGSAVSYSPFHHKRPHPADSEASSSGSSDDEDRDTGADSAARGGSGFVDPLTAGDGMPLSPRCITMPKGAKIKPQGEQDGDDGSSLQQEGSTLSDAMVAALPSMGQQSPAILSPFKPAPVCPPVHGGGLDSSIGSLLPPPLPLGGGEAEGGLAAMPHSSLAGGMEALMMQLPMPAMPRGDSMAHLLPLSRNASGMLGGGNSVLLSLDDGGAAGDLLSGLQVPSTAAMDLDALQPEEAEALRAAP